ncbi:MAG: ROK family protein [Blastocatellia bacterium]
MAQNILGIDLGGTKVFAAVFDDTGAILGKGRNKTEAERGDTTVFETIVSTGMDAIASAGLGVSDIAAVGIGSPGPLDYETGYIIDTPHLSFKDFPLGPRLSEAFGCPAFIDNDVNVAVYAEQKLGAARDASVVVGLWIGTGIGGGIVIHGELHHGYSKNAGELGHMVVRAGGPRCNCGARGCVEALGSRTGMARQIKKALREGKKTVFQKHQKKLAHLSSGDLREAYEGGDKVVIKVVHRAARYIGIATGSLINIIGPDVIVFGGGVIEAMSDIMLPEIQKWAGRVAFEYSMRGVRFVKAELGDDAGIVGASIIARERLTAQEGRPAEHQPGAAKQADTTMY